MLKGLKSVDLKIIQKHHFQLKWEYGMHKLVGLQLFSSGTPTFCQMGVLNSCLQNSSESSEHDKNPAAIPQKQVKSELILSIFLLYCRI